MSERRTRRRTWRAAWPWLLLAGSLALWTFAGRGARPLPRDAVAPGLEVTSSAGRFDLGAQRGRVVVLAFWATWCPACRAEAPALSRVHERIRRDGDGVLGVAVDGLPLEALTRAAARLGMRYPVAPAPREVFDRFHVELLPTVYVVGPRGHIRATFTGAASERAILAAVEAARRSEGAGT